MNLQLTVVRNSFHHLRSLIYQTKVCGLQELLSLFKKLRAQLERLEFLGPSLIPEILVRLLYLCVLLVHFQHFNAIYDSYLLYIPGGNKNFGRN